MQSQEIVIQKLVSRGYRFHNQVIAEAEAQAIAKLSRAQHFTTITCGLNESI